MCIACHSHACHQLPTLRCCTPTHRELRDITGLSSLHGVPTVWQGYDQCRREAVSRVTGTSVKQARLWRVVAAVHEALRCLLPIRVEDWVCDGEASQAASHSRYLIRQIAESKTTTTFAISQAGQTTTADWLPTCVYLCFEQWIHGTSEHQRAVLTLRLRP